MYGVWPEPDLKRHIFAKALTQKFGQLLPRCLGLFLPNFSASSHSQREHEKMRGADTCLSLPSGKKRKFFVRRNSVILELRSDPTLSKAHKHGKNHRISTLSSLTRLLGPDDGEGFFLPWSTLGKSRAAPKTKPQNRLTAYTQKWPLQFGCSD